MWGLGFNPTAHTCPRYYFSPVAATAGMVDLWWSAPRWTLSQLASLNILRLPYFMKTVECDRVKRAPQFPFLPGYISWQNVSALNPKLILFFFILTCVWERSCYFRSHTLNNTFYFPCWLEERFFSCFPLRKGCYPLAPPSGQTENRTPNIPPFHFEANFRNTVL